MEIIGLTKFLPTKFCFDQRFLPSVSGGEFEMATGSEEEEEEEEGGGGGSDRGRETIKIYSVHINRNEK